MGTKRIENKKFKKWVVTRSLGKITYQMIHEGTGLSIETIGNTFRTQMASPETEEKINSFLMQSA